MRILPSSRRSGRARRLRSGQAMLVAILTLGGAILGATTVAGLLLLYQIRASTDSENSAKAIFAADTGVNWALYSYFQQPPAPFPLPGNPAGTLSNGAVITVTCDNGDDNPIACDTNVTTTAISEGVSNGSRRAFLANLTDATGTLP